MMSKQEDFNQEELDLNASTEEIIDKVSEEADGEDEKDNEILKLQGELQETKDKYLRTVAEYDNYRKRTAKEKIDAYGDATARTVTEILAVVDNFERAMAAECSDEGFKSGMQMIFNQYIEILKKLGVNEIEAEGKEFDPKLHEAVTQIEDENLAENTVAQVFRKGYTLGDRVIRHAMVVVANP